MSKQKAPRPYKKEAKSEDILCNEQLFIDSPGDFLARTIVDELRKIQEWATLFRGGIHHYKKMDYSMRSLPALRVYIDRYTKQFDSWFIEGDVTLDIILPASLRRHELEDYPSQIANALLQQFRRPSYFQTLCELVPGVNELGKTFTVDKSLGFEVGNNVVPLTQITANFRIDIRKWDEYLEETFRTKDSPFEKVLGNLKLIAIEIQGLNDDLDENGPNVTLETNILPKNE